MFDIRNKTIVVAGATGKQGGAVARQLAQKGCRVKAITRDPSKPEARRLSDLGCEVIQGDLGDASFVSRVCQGAYGVFSVQTWWEDGVEEETRRGKLVADVAKSCGVQHFVYSSVANCDRRTDVPHFDSKWKTEEHIRSIELPYTILRPTFFMDNFDTTDFRESILNGRLSLALRPDRSLPLIAVEDIGAFAVLAFENPNEYIGQTLTLAGDQLTTPEVAGRFAHALDRPVTYVEQPMSEVRRYSPEIATMFEWFNLHGLEADVTTCRRLYPNIMDFETWLRRSGWVKRAEELRASRQVHISAI